VVDIFDGVDNKRISMGISNTSEQPKKIDQNNDLTGTATMYAQEHKELPIKTTENRMQYSLCKYNQQNDRRDTSKQPKKIDRNKVLAGTATMYAQEHKKLPIKTTESSKSSLFVKTVDDGCRDCWMSVERRARVCMEGFRQKHCDKKERCCEK
jgi:hypothetical protein